VDTIYTRFKSHLHNCLLKRNNKKKKKETKTKKKKKQEKSETADHLARTQGE